MEVYLANLVQELRVCELRVLTGLVPLPVHGNLVPIPRLHIAVHRVVAYVGLPPFEPLPVPSNKQPSRSIYPPAPARDNHGNQSTTYFDLDWSLGHIEVLGANLIRVPPLLPVELRRNLRPESGRVVDRPLVHLPVLIHSSW
jgi:hypothetical protein